MNRYLLFAGADYYPSPGWEDYHGDFETLEEALTAGAAHLRMGEDWWHIVDTEMKQIVERSR